MRTHFFGDGNGRTSRLVVDMTLMRNGLPPAQHPGDLSSAAIYAEGADQGMKPEAC